MTDTRQWNYPFSKLLNENFFHDHEGGFFIECGANDGLFSSVCHWFEEKRNWTGMNIEANLNCLEPMLENRPDCINLNYALGSEKKECDFIFSMSGLRQEQSSAGFVENITKESYVQQKKKGWEKLCIEKVEMRTFDQIMKEYEIKEVTLFILDIEGGEVDALKGMNDVLPEMVVAEHKLCDRNKMLAMMSDKGYIMTGTWRWNTIFIKKDCIGKWDEVKSETVDRGPERRTPRRREHGK